MNILSRCRGENVVAASESLPDCETAAETYMTATHEVPDLGTVIFLFKRFHTRKGKSSHWFWSVQNAILEQDLMAFNRANK